MPVQKEKKVSEKSTKQELWTAYNEAVGQVSNEDMAIQSDDSVNDVIKKLSETKIHINSQFDELTKSLLGDLGELYKTSEQIRQNKEGLIKHFENQKKDLQYQMEEVKNKWAIEEKKLDDEFKQKKVDQENGHQRQEEEYKYNLDIIRKKEYDEYLTEKTARGKAIAEQEEMIANRKKEIAEMEKQIAEMPALIERKVKEAEEKLSEDLTSKYQNQIKELSINKEHNAKISEIKIANLETTIKNQTEEISGLKLELSKVSAMMKEMAVSAIEAKKPTIMSSKSVNENQ
ncbi:MAG: hypothetical protein NTY30_02720 [Candidatus Berkelbacteria bacterium]|nr:hypothetical protein [Candidatus Berkelbacteria bacterium]